MFESPFESDKKESETTEVADNKQLQEIELPDTNEEDFRTLLQCIYTDSASIEPDRIARLWKMAKLCMYVCVCVCVCVCVTLRVFLSVLLPHFLPFFVSFFPWLIVDLYNFTVFPSCFFVL
jgi:BTB/POZ domain